MNNIGSYMKALREARHYSIRKLSMLSKVSHATISRMENSVTFPNPSTLQKIAKPLGASYELLLIIAGYLDRGGTLSENIKSIREKSGKSYMNLSNELFRSSGLKIDPAYIEKIESGEEVDIIPGFLDALAKCEGVNVNFLLMDHAPGDDMWDTSASSQMPAAIPDQELSHIKDKLLRQWIAEPQNLRYLKFAKKVGELKIAPEFILDEFISRIFVKNDKKSKQPDTSK
jgi:transcriptional regulator with XRE-family HTH domain